MSGPRFEAINQEKEQENRIQYIIITIEIQHDNGVRDGPIYLFIYFLNIYLTITTQIAHNTELMLHEIYKKFHAPSICLHKYINLY